MKNRVKLAICVLLFLAPACSITRISPIDCLYNDKNGQRICEKV